MATTPETAATALDASDESSTALLYRSAIGTQGLDFYLKVFSRFDALDRAGLSWNTAASLCTINWMVLHRMWAAALVYAGSLIGLALLIFGIGQLVFQFSETTTWMMLAVFASIFFILPGLFGNAVFHTHCRKRMESALAASATVEDACKLLERKAGSKKRVIVLALVNLLLVVAAALAYWLFPQPGAIGAELKKAAEGGHVATGRATESSAAAASAPAAVASAPSAGPAEAQAPALPAASTPAFAASAAVTPSPAASAAAVATPAPGAATVPAISGTLRKASAPSTADAKPAGKAPSVAARASEPTGNTAATPANAKSLAPVATSAATGATIGRPAVAASAVKATAGTAPAVARRSATADARVAAATTPPRAAPAGSTPITKNAAANAKAAALDPASFYINVGLFAKDDNARNAHAKVHEAGISAFTQELRGSKGKLTRVRAGPFISQADADAAAEKIHSLGLDAVVFKP
jgi:cell division septation protein DedD